MNSQHREESDTRVGEQFRSNPDRFFHVLTQGWYVFTREGIRGPFVDRHRANGYLKGHITDLNTDQDPSASWRL
jgi:hypothetical protein